MVVSLKALTFVPLYLTLMICHEIFNKGKVMFICKIYIINDTEKETDARYMQYVKRNIMFNVIANKTVCTYNF